MRKSLADRAPFKAVRIEGIEPLPDHKFREWQERGFTKFIVDRHGVVLRLLREGVDAEAMANEMNERAAELLMVHGTEADPEVQAKRVFSRIDAVLEGVFNDQTQGR